MSVADIMQVIIQANGCVMCLDWTGGHQCDTCKEGKPYCMELVNGSPCGTKHDKLLHGSNSCFCNLMNVSTGKKVESTEGNNQCSQEKMTLLPMQLVPAKGKVW